MGLVRVVICVGLAFLMLYLGYTTIRDIRVKIKEKKVDKGKK